MRWPHFDIGARWRSFAREADATRESSLRIWSLISERRIGGESKTVAVRHLKWPVSGRVTSQFGMRHGRLHEGIDIALPTGSPVHPAFGGVALFAGEMESYGNVIVIDHGGSYETVYAHLDRLEVAAKQRVESEQRIGAVGTTGRAFGAHLHFEVRFEGTAVDPLVLLEKESVDISSTD